MKAASGTRRRVARAWPWLGNFRFHDLSSQPRGGPLKQVVRTYYPYGVSTLPISLVNVQLLRCGLAPKICLGCREIDTPRVRSLPGGLPLPTSGGNAGDRPAAGPGCGWVRERIAARSCPLKRTGGPLYGPPVIGSLWVARATRNSPSGRSIVAESRRPRCPARRRRGRSAAREAGSSCCSSRCSRCWWAAAVTDSTGVPVSPWKDSNGVSVGVAVVSGSVRVAVAGSRGGSRGGRRRGCRGGSRGGSRRVAVASWHAASVLVQVWLPWPSPPTTTTVTVCDVVEGSGTSSD